jgi:hypothetical protein
LAGGKNGRDTCDVGDWSLETPFTGCCEFGVEVALRAALAFLGLSSVSGTLLVPQLTDIALVVVLVASVDSGLIDRDLPKEPVGVTVVVGVHFRHEDVVVRGVLVGTVVDQYSPFYGGGDEGPACDIQVVRIINPGF